MHGYLKVFNGASLLSASEIIGQGCSLVRNIILARFLAKADFGVAALLGMILTLFELTSKMGFGQQVVQSRHGNDPGFLENVHFAQFATGALSALLIAIAALPLAHFFAGPQYLSSIMALALVPFISGLSSLDVYRRTRNLTFWPVVVSDAVPQLLTTLAAWPVAAALRDYRAVLGLLLGKALLTAIGTHAVAERRFAIRINGRWLRETLRFGLPLLLGGFVQFGNFQGDSMVVAAAYPLAQLGEYSVAMTLAMAPGFAILRVCHSISLPLLSEVQGDTGRFAARYARYAELMAVLSCWVVLGMLCCGEQAVVLLYGAKYSGIGALACWLVAAQAIRILRGATVAAAMARGDTVNNLVSTSWRLSGLVLAIVVGLLKGSLVWFAAAGLAGEIAALAAAAGLLRRDHSIPSRATFEPALVAALCVALVGAAKWALAAGPSSPINWFLLPPALCISLALFAAWFPELRSLMLNFGASLGARLCRITSKEWRLLPGVVQPLSRDTDE
jgi:O-antigen/teichoic acid export membrane protein